MEKIRQLFEQNVSLSDADWQVFASKLEPETFPSQATLLQAGQVENYLSFIEKGMVRYFIPQEEHDLTFGFSFEDEFMSAYDSFLTQTPASYSIATLAPTKIWRMKYKDLQAVYRESSVGNTIGRYAAAFPQKIQAGTGIAP